MNKLRGLGKRDPIAFCDWMDGYCEGFDDLSDGAWQSCCETGVESHNKEFGTHIDPHDGWMFWINQRRKEK